MPAIWMVPDQEHNFLVNIVIVEDSLLMMASDSCPLADSDRLAKVCAGFGTTSQHTCFLLKAAMTSSGFFSLLAACWKIFNRDIHGSHFSLYF
jgi:hypothetical protein